MSSTDISSSVTYKFVVSQISLIECNPRHWKPKQYSVENTLLQLVFNSKQRSISSTDQLPCDFCIYRKSGTRTTLMRHLVTVTVLTIVIDRRFSDIAPFQLMLHPQLSTTVRTDGMTQQLVTLFAGITIIICELLLL